MTLIVRLLLVALGIAIAAVPTLASETELRVAVATNFLPAARELGKRFESRTGQRVSLAAGSTGKLYAQIVNGAPFDVFLAADSERPLRLEADGVAVADSRKTYARGALAVWSRDANRVPPDGLPNMGDLRRFAIANPALAPYGAAARDALQSLGVWNAIEPKLVRGESIGQAFQFVATGNAQAGMIAVSQLPAERGSFWTVPAELHRPIDQQLVLLSDSAAAREFVAFLGSAEAGSVMLAAGYTLPGD